MPEAEFRNLRLYQVSLLLRYIFLASIAFVYLIENEFTYVQLTLVYYTLLFTTTFYILIRGYTRPKIETTMRPTDYFVRAVLMGVAGYAAANISFTIVNEYINSWSIDNYHLENMKIIILSASLIILVTFLARNKGSIEFVSQLVNIKYDLLMNRYSVDEAAERLDHATFGIPESNLNLQKLLRSAEKILVLQDCIEKKCDQLENFTSSKRDYQNKRGGESDEFNYNSRKKQIIICHIGSFYRLLNYLFLSK